MLWGLGEPSQQRVEEGTVSLTPGSTQQWCSEPLVERQWWHLPWWVGVRAAWSAMGKQLQSPVGPGRQGSSILPRVMTEEGATSTCPGISHHCKCGAGQPKQTGYLGPCGGLISDWKAWEWQGGRDEVLHCAGVIGSKIEAFKIICNSMMKRLGICRL